jgi:predicted dehydrogenase
MEHTRRSFLSSAIAAAPLLAPQGVWGANDRLAYGLIGAGGRGRDLTANFKKLGAECVAVADVYEPNLQSALRGSPDAKGYADYHDLLAQPGLDAVVVAAPDHHHAPMLFAALEAKKDVYLEKPMSHSLEESQRIIDAVRKSKQIVQVGMQRRSAPAVLEAKQILDSGILGKITLVKPMWNWNVSKPLDNTPLPGKLDWKRFLGSAPERDLEPMRFRSWRYFWEYSGGNMTDQGTHLMDVVQWFTNSGMARSAVCYGQKAKNTGSEVPDVFCAVFEYPNLMATWTLNYCNSYENDWSIQFQGDQGTMILNAAGYRIWKEPVPSNPAPVQQKAAPIPLEAHIQNFMDCVKSRQEPNAPVEVGASAVSAPHLANVAFHAGRQARLSADGFSAG